jgi:hypothetical protein
VNLGIKGAEKTVGALTSVKKGLGEIGSTSIEAKAGILGAMYGLERMMALSGAAGTGLTNFAALTGLSAKSLQQWQYAARQAGVSGEELTGSFKGVQNSMTNMLMGKGAPEYMALVSKAVGGIKPEDYRNTVEMMKHLQQAMQTMTPDMARQAGASFGLSEGTIAAMRRNAFTPDMMNKAPTYSDREIGQLDKANIAWSNLGNKVEMAFGHFNASHGGQLVGDISKLVPQVLQLANAFVGLAEKMKIFQTIGDAFKGWTMIFQTMTSLVNSVQSAEGWKNMFSGIGEALKGMGVNDTVGGKELTAQQVGESDNDYAKRLIAAGHNRGNGGSTTVNNNTSVHQNIAHYGDAKDTKSVKDTHGAAANQAYRQRDTKQVN